jgi:hypothetical protein
MRALEMCYAVPGSDWVISIFDMQPGETVSPETLEKIRAEYPGVELMLFDDWRAAKAARQDAQERKWIEVTHDAYWWALECLPPAAMWRGAFLVGEPQDHHVGTGRPRFRCLKEEQGKFYELTAPITCAEFKAMFGGAL